MFKKIYLFFIMIGVLQIHAMDMPVVCYLAQIPCDVQSLIAYYLTCEDETKEEFIKRTLPEKNSSEAFNAFFCKNIFLLEGVKKYCAAFGCNYTNIALIRMFHQNTTCTLFELEPDQSIKLIKKNDPLVPANYSAVAISQTGTMFATIATKCINPSSSTYKKNKVIHTLCIYKIGKKSPMMRYIPGYIENILATAFNKQGTHLIVHGTLNEVESTKKNAKELKPYLMYPLKTNKSIHIEKQRSKSFKNELEKYFYEKKVCKKIPVLN